MGDDRVGATSVGKSFRSLLEALRSLEREVEVVFERATERPTDAVLRVLRLFSEAQKGLRAPQVLRLLREIAPFPRTGQAARKWGELLGLADQSSLEAIRDQLRELAEQVARLREREVALAGGLSQLRARASRFDDALAGLARVQGRYVAKMAGQQVQAERVEHLAYRRDDHITRLIRDTAAQRAEIERLVREMEEDRRRGDAPSQDAEVSSPPPDSGRLQAVERAFDELRKAQKTGTQSVIDTLESLRERLGRLEARAVEMSREARAKSGRIDALARHVASVDGRLSTAIGGRGAGAIVTTTERVDAPAVIGGQT
jgi:DNA repair exonuclease SbcCD ATPase subunit